MLPRGSCTTQVLQGVLVPCIAKHVYMYMHHVICLFCGCQVRTILALLSYPDSCIWNAMYATKCNPSFVVQRLLIATATSPANSWVHRFESCCSKSLSNHAFLKPVEARSVRVTNRYLFAVVMCVSHTCMYTHNISD